MIRLPPRSPRIATPYPYAPRCRSRRPLAGSGGGQGAQGFLGGVVFQRAHVRVHAVQADHVDHPPPALPLHRRIGRLHRPQRAAEPAGESALDVLVGLVLHPREVGASPRVLDAALDPVLLVAGVLDHPLTPLSLAPFGPDHAPPPPTATT